MFSIVIVRAHTTAWSELFTLDAVFVGSDDFFIGTRLDVEVVFVIPFSSSSGKLRTKSSTRSCNRERLELRDMRSDVSGLNLVSDSDVAVVPNVVARAIITSAGTRDTDLLRSN